MPIAYIHIIRIKNNKAIALITIPAIANPFPSLAHFLDSFKPIIERIREITAAGVQQTKETSETIKPAIAKLLVLFGTPW